MAVFVYVHGGSNRVGMGAMLRGDILAAFGDIIVVNFNYRLGSLVIICHDILLLNLYLIDIIRFYTVFNALFILHYILF